MDNKDFDKVVEWAGDVLGELGMAVLSFLEYVPDWLKGAVITVLIIMWIVKKIL